MFIYLLFHSLPVYIMVIIYPVSVVKKRVLARIFFLEYRQYEVGVDENPNKVHCKCHLFAFPFPLYTKM